MSEEPPADLFRADPKCGGQKTLSCSPKLTMSEEALAMCEARASHHALTDSTRAANATNRVRSMTCATEFFSESIPSWQPHI